MTPRAGVRSRGATRYLLATSALALILMAPNNAVADDFSGFEPFPMSTDISDWEVDRRAPAVFERLDTFEGRSNVLLLGIEPPQSPNSFERFEGYKQRTQVPAGNSFLRGDIWIQDGWQSGDDTDYVRTGMWGDAMPEDLVAQGQYVNDAAVFPIVQFTNRDGVGRLEVWDTTDGGFVDLPETADMINYDGWNTIDMRLLPDQGIVQYLFNGQVIYTWRPESLDPSLGDPNQFFQMYLQGVNNDVTSFNTYWSRLLSGLLIAAGEDVGDTPGDVVIDPNDENARNVFVIDGARIGGTILSQGGDIVPVIEFEGSVEIVGNLISQSTEVQFATNDDANAVIGGNVILEDGSTVFGGTLSSPIRVNGNVMVDGSSLFGGNWSIGGNLDVDGLIGPGNSIGVVTVAGDVAFNAGSTLQAEVSLDGPSDLVTAGGAATISSDGTVLDVTILPGGLPTSAAVYTVLRADGGVTGRFATVVTKDNLPDLDLVARYTSTEVQLVFEGATGGPLSPKQIHPSALGAGMQGGGPVR